MTTTKPDTPTRTWPRPAVRALVVLATVLATVLAWAIIVPILGVEVTVPEGAGSDDRVDLALGPVIGASLMPSLAAWALLEVLERVAGRRARLIWTGVALAVFVITLPYAPGFTAAERVALTILHLVVATVLILGLRRTSTP